MKQNLKRYVANIAKTTLKTSAPTTPQKIIFFLFLGTKFAAIKPIIIALSAARIISIKIICNNINDCSPNDQLPNDYQQNNFYDKLNY